MNFKGKSGDFEKPATGVVGAVCYRVIDLGTQESEWNGKKTTKQKVVIGWELDQKMKDGRPFVIQKRYTRSLHENSALRKDLESWRGKVFTPQEIEEFNETKILGKHCLLTLVASEDGEFVNVQTVTGLPKNMAGTPQINPSHFLSLDPAEFKQEAFDALGDKTKELIMKSPEWKALKGETTPSTEEAPAEEVPF